MTGESIRLGECLTWWGRHRTTCSVVGIVKTVPNSGSNRKKSQNQEIRFRRLNPNFKENMFIYKAKLLNLVIQTIFLFKLVPFMKHKISMNLIKIFLLGPVIIFSAIKCLPANVTPQSYNRTILLRVWNRCFSFFMFLMVQNKSIFLDVLLWVGLSCLCNLITLDPVMESGADRMGLIQATFSW